MSRLVNTPASLTGTQNLDQTERSNRVLELFQVSMKAFILDHFVIQIMPHYSAYNTHTLYNIDPIRKATLKHVTYFLLCEWSHMDTPKQRCSTEMSKSAVT